jgi:Zn-dependent protease with chaperone function
MAFAIFFDGHSARMHRVILQAGDGALTVRGDDFARIYRSTEGELAEPFAGAPGLLYLPDGARCEVACPRARAALAEALGYRKPRVVRWQERWRGALAALALLAGLLAWAGLRGVPAAADRAAQALPASVDTTLGASALREMKKQGIINPTRLSSQRVDEIWQVLRTLLPAKPRVPVRLVVCASDTLGANALALPDGTIIVTDALVRLILGKHGDFDTARGAQLAGVLAHELGHLERRHGMRALARGSLAAALSAALFGDFSTAAAGAPALLLNMRYSRDMESEADLDAIALLRSHHLSPAPLADLFEALDRTPQATLRRRLPRWLTAGGDYTASHPSNAERAALLRAAAAGP